MNILTKVKELYNQWEASSVPVPELKTISFGGTGWNGDMGNWVDSSLPGNRYSSWSGRGACGAWRYGDWDFPLYYNSAYMACVGCYLDAFAQAPVCLKEKVGKEKNLIDYEAAPDLIRRLMDMFEEVNDTDDMVSLMDATLLDLIGPGNAYWLIVKDKATEPRELEYIPQYQIKPIRPVDLARNANPADPRILYYEWHKGGAPEKLKPEELVHIRLGKDPDAPHLGLGRGSLLMREIFTDNEATEYSGQVLANMGISPQIFSPAPPPAGMTSTGFDADTIVKMIQQARAGRNRGKTVALDMLLNIHESDNSPEKMALDVIRQYPEARIAAVMRVPAKVAGLLVGEATSTFANVEEAKESFWQDAVIPMMRRIRSQVTRQLIRRSDLYPRSLWFGFDYGEVPALQVDEQARDKNLRENFKYGLIDAAEARTMMGMEAKPEDEGRMYKPNANPAEEDEDPEEAALARMVDGKSYVSPLQRITAELALLEAAENGNGHG